MILSGACGERYYVKDGLEDEHFVLRSKPRIDKICKLT
jgi:hypothetical protein